MFARTAGPWLAREYWDELRAEAEEDEFLKPALFRRRGRDGWRRVSYRELAGPLGIGHERTVRRLFAGDLSWIQMRTLEGIRDALEEARQIARKLEAHVKRVEKSVAVGASERERRNHRVLFYRGEIEAIQRASNRLGRHIESDLVIPTAEAVDAGAAHSERVRNSRTPADEMRLWRRFEGCTDLAERRLLLRRVYQLQEGRDGRRRPPGPR